MDAKELKERTKQFSLNIVDLVEHLPKRTSMDIIGKQLLRSATSVGANYRSACRARSRADFVAKIAVAEEEADESSYWLELLIAGQQNHSSSMTSLFTEAEELTAILAASRKTAKYNQP